MKRMVSVWLPHWPIERLWREQSRHEKTQAEGLAHQPFALVGNEARGLRLTAVNIPAKEASLSVGLALADARTICPALLTSPAQPEKDATGLAALARWTERFSPIRNRDEDDGLWLDVTGLAHLFGGEQKLLETIRAGLARLGVTARLALADTYGCAWALARLGPEPLIIVPPGAMSAALAPLGMEALRLSPQTVRQLERLGLKRVGQLYDLPRTSLKRRFASKAEAVLTRLDQALGRHEEGLIPLRYEPPQEAILSFPEPLISHEGVAAALQRLSEILGASLACAGHGARRIHLELARADGIATRVDAGFSLPCRDPAHFCRLLGEKLNGLDLGFGIDQMRLRASALEPLVFAQTALTTERSKAELGPLIDRLANRLGPKAVRRLVPIESHLPERAQTAHSAFASPKPWPRDVLKTLRAKPPRPIFLLARPEPLAVTAEIPEGPPARFLWRRVSRRIVKAEGPERIAPEWWRTASQSSKPDDGTRSSRPCPQVARSAVGQPKEAGSAQKRTRDYYWVEDEEGRRYWVFREGLYQAMEEEDGTPAWFLQGVFG